jgi:CHAD domain-containing protein
MRLDDALLDGDAAGGARVLALARLADAEEVAVRLGEPDDVEALHDFRVALRRLRSTLKLLAPALEGALNRKQLRRLRGVARRTGAAREDEVLLAWLEEARDRLAAPYRGALDWLIDRVELRRAEAVREVLDEAWPRFRRLAPRLSRRLSARVQAGAQPASLSALLAGALRTQLLALRAALGEVVGGEDATGLHQARIEAKRLRYLLEPLRGHATADASEAVAALKALQDLLGSWHDRHQAREALASALVEAAADRARRGRGAESGDLRPGLLALDLLAEDEAVALYASLGERFLDARATPLLDLGWAVVAGLEGADAAERPVPAVPQPRWLLTGLPPEVSGGSVEEVAQGWLPLDGEQLGLVRSTEGDRTFRVRPGTKGAVRVESIGRAEFEAWWPLTEGRRLAHRSHRLATLPGWRFDEFADLRLVLAVVEAGGDPTPPPWLEPAVVREVTGERGYRDEALVRRTPRR